MSAGDVIFNADLNTKPFDRAIAKLQNKRLNWKFFTAGLKASTEQWKKAQREALRYKEIYEGLTEQGKALKDSMDSMIGGPTLSQQEAWEELSDKIKQAKSDMEEADSFMKHAERGRKAKDLFGKGLGAVLGATKGIIGGIIGGFKRLFSVLTSGVTRIIALVGAVALMRKGLQNLIAVDKATANSVNQIKSSLATLGNAMASAVAPLIQAVAPVITKIIDLFVRASNAVAMFFSALTGKKVTMVATQVAGGFDGIGDSASGANDSAKELQRTLMGFDKINKLDGDKGSGGGGSGGGGSGGGGGFSTVPISEDALDWADKFKESWEKADFYWLGETLAEKINEALEKIPWDKINAVLEKVAKSLGTFLNGFVETLDWSLLAESISKGIESALNFVSTLLETINWQSIGKAIVDFICGIDWAGLFSAGARLAGNIVGAIAGALAGAGQEVVQKIKDYFIPYIDACGGDIIAGLYEGIVRGIAGIPTWIYDHIFKPFIDGFKNAFGINSPSTVMAEQGHFIIDGLLKGIQDKWSNVTDWVSGIPDRIISALGNIGETIKTAIKNKVESLDFSGINLKDLASNVTAKLNIDTSGFWSGWNNIKTTWNGIKDKFATSKLNINTSAFWTGWNRVKGAWNSIKNKTATVTIKFTDWIKSKWNALAGKVNRARNNSAFARKLLPYMPYLAEGGYVKANTPQLAMIGDNKHEGEIVAPESKLQEMANRASSNPQMIALLTQILNAIQSMDTNVYLDGESIKNNTVRRINNHTRATGQLELII